MTEAMISKTTLILGGARSGKSAFAEKTALQSNLQPVYLATSQAFDDEMQDRITLHQTTRGPEWQTIEEPINLSKILISNARADKIILVDCLTLWVSNLMMADRNIEDEISTLCKSFDQFNGPVIFVSNEVGQGIVPDNPMARSFRDHAGRLHQAIAAQAKAVFFITAGLPQRLK